MEKQEAKGTKGFLTEEITNELKEKINALLKEYGVEDFILCADNIGDDEFQGVVMTHTKERRYILASGAYIFNIAQIPVAEVKGFLDDYLGREMKAYEEAQAKLEAKDAQVEETSK